MSDETKMSQENIAYALQQLSGFDPEDIECDDFDIAVNDDQFATMSIVRLAGIAAESQDNLIRENGGLSETVKMLLIENLDKSKDNDRLVEENAELREFAKYCQGFLGCEETRDSMALHGITIKAKELLNK